MGEDIKKQKKKPVTSSQKKYYKKNNNSKYNSKKKKAYNNKKTNVKEDKKIIERQLDIDLNGYVDNHDGLVKEIKNVIELENALDEDNGYLSSFYDPLDGEELITDTFKRKKIWDRFKFDNNVFNKIYDNRNLILTIICLLMFIAFIILLILYNIMSSKLESNNNDERNESYNKCLSMTLEEDEYPSELEDKINDLTKYLDDNYKVSVLYEDINKGYKYLYKDDLSYSTGSLINTLDVLYLYDKKIDLNDTIKYTKKYKDSNSTYLKDVSYGTEISLKDLVKYAIIYSDNSAHKMLMNYIGKDKLKEYGESLGATNVLSKSNEYGNVDVNDVLSYLKKLNELISVNDELKEIYMEANDNSLSDLDTVLSYSIYSNYNHRMGIVYDENPYIIIILTSDIKTDEIKDISNKVNELHKEFYKAREDVCKTGIYG